MDNGTQTTFDVESDTRQIHETYVNAIHHDTASIPADAVRVGVVNINMYGLGNVTETNFTALGPPSALFDEFRTTRGTMESQGKSPIDAHNDAWDTVGFEQRYAEYLRDGWENNTAVREACETILELHDEQPVAIVCYEGDEKQCHRHVLQEFLNGKL